VFVHGVGVLQPTDECEGIYVLTAARDLGELALQEVMYDLRLSLCLILTERR